MNRKFILLKQMLMVICKKKMEKPMMIFLKLLVFALLLFNTIFISSCKKCTTCELKQGGGTTIYTYQEACGKKEIEQVEKECKNDAIRVDGGGRKWSCICITK